MAKKTPPTSGKHAGKALAGLAGAALMLAAGNAEAGPRNAPGTGPTATPTTQTGPVGRGSGPSGDADSCLSCRDHFNPHGGGGGSNKDALRALGGVVVTAIIVGAFKEFSKSRPQEPFVDNSKSCENPATLIITGDAQTVKRWKTQFDSLKFDPRVLKFESRTGKPGEAKLSVKNGWDHFMEMDPMLVKGGVKRYVTEVNVSQYNDNNIYDMLSTRIRGGLENQVIATQDFKVCNAIPELEGAFKAKKHKIIGTLPNGSLITVPIDTGPKR